MVAALVVDPAISTHTHTIKENATIVLLQIVNIRPKVNNNSKIS